MGNGAEKRITIAMEKTQEGHTEASTRRSVYKKSPEGFGKQQHQIST